MSKFTHRMLLGGASAMLGVVSALYLHAPLLLSSMTIQFQNLNSQIATSELKTLAETGSFPELQSSKEVAAVTLDERQPTGGSQPLVTEPQVDQPTEDEESIVDEGVWRDVDPIWVEPDVGEEEVELLSLDALDDQSPHSHDEC